MSQYERIVSYIYSYNHGQKEANVGFAKVEKRGNVCRISVQMRAVPAHNVPKVYLFQQFKEGIRTIPVGVMTARGSNLLCKVSSDAGNLFQSEFSIDDIEGIFIDIGEDVCFATSWKNDVFYLGNWKNMDKKTIENTPISSKKEIEEVQIQQDEIREHKESNTQDEEIQKSKEIKVQQSELQESEEKEIQHSETQESNVKEVQYAEIPEDKTKEMQYTEMSESKVKEAKYSEIQEKKDELQMQSICGVCPFKRKMFDYGKKILMTFPSMKPFEQGVAKACVRMELQDIGCLPISSWSLSGNRFLLHGYYCYRHLIFAQLTDGQYVLGVPGIYSDKEKNNAIRFGFSKFQSIGKFNQMQGVFGYWLLALPEGEDSDFFK